MKHIPLLLLGTALAAGCAHIAPVQTASVPALSETVPAPSSNTLSPPNAVYLTADKAALTGCTVQTKLPGFTGSGYAGEFQTDGAKAVWTIPHARAGLYRVVIRYATPYGVKGYDLVVNGSRLSGMFAATNGVWADQPAGQVELQSGANTVSIEKGWGYYDINAIDLAPVIAAPALKAPPLTLSDMQATPQARALLRTMASAYGAKTMSGQYDADDTRYVQTKTKRTPAIMGGDLIEYSPSRLAHGSDPKNESERLIQAAKAGQIVTLSWHWNAPAGLIDNKNALVDGKPTDEAWYKGFNANATTFNVQPALADPHSPEYALLLRDIDAIAVQLQKFSDAGVPVLWRPLHEAEGGWFWWGAHGPQPFKQLWRLMHDRLTHVHHLHNLIWVYSDTQSLSPAWYPGDDVVDIVGVDAYPSDVADSLSSTWDTMLRQHGRRKLLALTEFGGVPDVEKMQRYGVRWAYFVSWTGDVGPHKMTADTLKRLYQEPSVITQETLRPAKP